MSKAEMVRRTGISTPTVSKIVDYFATVGLLIEAGEAITPIGRKPTLLQIVPDSFYTIGAVFDGRWLSVGLVDLFGQPHGLRRTQMPVCLEQLLEKDLPAAVLQLMDEEEVPLSRIKGIGVGVPGVVDPSGEIVRFAPIVGIDKDFEASSSLRSLEDRLGFPVKLENDANASALGEHAARSRTNNLNPQNRRATKVSHSNSNVSDRDFIFVELSRGLGAGIILDGKLRRGPRNMAGEIGYLVLDPSWNAITESPGWLEKHLELDELWTEIDNQRVLPEWFMQRIIPYLALGLSNICVSLDLDLIIVGRSVLQHFGDAFLDTLRAELARLSVLRIRCVPSILEEPGVSGTAEIVTNLWLERLFSE